MNNDTLLKELKTNSMTFTVKEIQEMMDEELNKSPEEMDTELVDLCADVLNKIYYSTNEEKVIDINDNMQSKEKAEKTSRKIKLSKVLLIAAVFIIITSIAIPVSAKHINNEASEKIVQFYIDHFKINLHNNQTNSTNYSNGNIDLIEELNVAGFENIILPSIFFENNYSKDDIRVYEDESYLSAEIDFKIEESVNGYIEITKHKTDFTLFNIGQGNIGEQYDSVKQITVNGMDILVFSSEETIQIIYVDEKTEYSIHIDNCDFDLGIKIAKTLK